MAGVGVGAGAGAGVVAECVVAGAVAFAEEPSDGEVGVEAGGVVGKLGERLTGGAGVPLPIGLPSTGGCLPWALGAEPPAAAAGALTGGMLAAGAPDARVDPDRAAFRLWVEPVNAISSTIPSSASPTSPSTVRVRRTRKTGRRSRRRRGGTDGVGTSSASVSAVAGGASIVSASDIRSISGAPPTALSVEITDPEPRANPECADRRDRLPDDRVQVPVDDLRSGEDRHDSSERKERPERDGGLAAPADAEPRDHADAEHGGGDDPHHQGDSRSEE